jgi:hypothetical protein
MSKIVLVLPVVKPPKCNNCKWAIKLNEDTLICSTFKVGPVFACKVESESNNVYLLDTEIARKYDQFCGYYGTHFEPK